MRIAPEQLESQLRRGLLPVYLISGDELLQRQEAADTLRAEAKHQGFGERRVFEANEPGFHWEEAFAWADNLSLFADRQIIDLRLANAKIGDKGSTAIVRYCTRPSPDNLLLITCPRLDKAQQALKWVKTIEQVGGWVQVWPIEGAKLLGWLTARLKSRGMAPSPEAVALLAERVEGHLLAAHQEVERALLLYGPGPLTVEQIRGSAADSARFDVYALVDAALLGQSRRVLRILEVLRGEDTASAIILWALAREIRVLAALAFAESHGQATAEVLTAYRVFDHRRPLLQQAQKRLPLDRLQDLLCRCAMADRVLKGRQSGDEWDSLLAIGLGMSGK